LSLLNPSKLDPERAALALSEISVAFGDRAVFTNLSCEFPSGRYIGLVGPNGSGKTSLAKVLVGLLIPTSGQVERNGHTVGLVMANPENQIVSLLVEEDLAFGPENLNLAPAEINARIEAALHKTHSNELRCQLTSNLSGGQLSKIAFAGQLTIDADVLIVDEGTAMLDPLNRLALKQLILDLNKRHAKTIIHISHRLDDLEDADIVMLLSADQVRCFDNVFDLLAVIDGIEGIEAGERIQYLDFLRSHSLTGANLCEQTKQLRFNLV